MAKKESSNLWPSVDPAFAKDAKPLKSGGYGKPKANDYKPGPGTDKDKQPRVYNPPPKEDDKWKAKTVAGDDTERIYYGSAGQTMDREEYNNDYQKGQAKFREKDKEFRRKAEEVLKEAHRGPEPLSKKSKLSNYGKKP